MNLPLSSGFSSYMANIGEVRNQGFELSMSGYILRLPRKHINWIVSGQLVYNKNEITHLSEAIKQQNEEYHYANDYAKDDLKAVYNKLFYAITQTNILLKNIDENGGVLDSDPVLKAVIRGEAHALRAYCQFDLLRLFSQIPDGKGQRRVRLPYSSMKPTTQPSAFSPLKPRQTAASICRSWKKTSAC